MTIGQREYPAVCRFNDYTELFIRPLIMWNDDIEHVAEKNAQFWGVYGKFSDGTDQHILDVEDKATAQRIARFLSWVHPHIKDYD